jgi:hypothetical protein
VAGLSALVVVDADVARTGAAFNVAGKRNPHLGKFAGFKAVLRIRQW